MIKVIMEISSDGVGTSVMANMQMLGEMDVYELHVALTYMALHKLIDLEAISQDGFLNKEQWEDVTRVAMDLLRTVSEKIDADTEALLHTIDKGHVQ
jgi:hypothetical protein